MKSTILLIPILLIMSFNSVCAEKLATELHGKIVTNNPAGLQVHITESDGSILDMATTTPAGGYTLDLTIMDTPSQTEVEKLTLEVKNKFGKKKKYKIKNYIKSFGNTVELKPILYIAN